MKPGCLLRACAQVIAHSLMSSISHLVITETPEKDRLVCVLVWFMERYGEILFSNVILQDQIYKSLIGGLRCHHNPPICFTVMIVLCPKVTIDQIAVVEDHNGLPPLVAGTGLDITQEECDAILDIISNLKKNKAITKRSNQEGYCLPSTSLVLEGIYFHDPDFLTVLFKEMPHLHHIELQYNGTPSVLKALSKNCPQLETLSFLEPRMEVSVLEKDILPILFGIPPSAYQSNSTTLLSRFAEDESFRNLFVVQYPNLKKLNLDELYFEEDLLHDVYTLALVMHPDLICFGKHTGLTRNILSKFRRLWTIKNEKPYSFTELLLTKAKFVDSVFDVQSDVELELRYIEDVLPMFKSLKSVELQKHYWNERDIGQFCNLFAHQVEAFSLTELPVNQISCLNSVTHLRLTFTRQYSFDQVHFILDHCIHLQTLSIHSVFHERLPANGDGLHPLQNFGRMMEDDQHILENILAHQMAVHAFIGEALQEEENNEGNPQEAINLAAAAAAPPPPPVRGYPDPYRPLGKNKKLNIHSKLTTLRIASLFEAAQQPSESFLLSLLARLPNLRNICLGMWMGALSQRRDHLTCVGNALVNVVTSQVKTKPLLTELEQLCCLPSGTEREMCASLVRLSECLPSLHTIVVPALDSFLLTPTLGYFKYSNIEIRHKCATDQVFSHWEPEH